MTFTLYGSFADTYQGHGTDRALVGGLLGYRPDDIRIRNSFEHARKDGLDFRFVIDHETETNHPNTVDILMESGNGHTLLVRGESIGGGRVRIVRMNDIDVDFTGEYSTLIVGHKDRAGTLAYITGKLAEHRLNIAFMKLFREEEGGDAFTVIESDDPLPEELRDELLAYQTIRSVDMIEL